MRYAILIAAVVSFSAQPQAQAPAAACIKAADACTEWVALGSGSARSLIYRSKSLDVRNPAIQRALIAITKQPRLVHILLSRLKS